MKYAMVDFHCHLDLYPDFENVINESEQAGIYTLGVTTTPRAWQRNYELTKGLKFVRPSLGLHPQLVGDNTAKELHLWERLLPQAKYVGEVGLDAGPGYYHTLDEQKEVFARILALCAIQGGKVLSVHAIRSVSTVLDMIDHFLPRSRGIVVLHWFTGTSAQARRAIDLGCYFSINASMLHKERGRSLVQSIPLDRILTETDGPFAKIDDRVCRPNDIREVIEALSTLHGVSFDEMSIKIITNLKSILAA